MSLYELQSDLRDTMDLVRKLLADFNAGKTQLVSVDRTINSDAIDEKMHRTVLEEKQFF